MIAAATPTSAPRRTRLAGLVAACVVAAAALLAGVALDASAAHADDTIGISGVPAGADGNADGRTRFSYTAEPGQMIDDNYLVRNTGTTTQTFTVLATDAFNDEDGKFALLATAQDPIDVGSWVSLDGGATRLRFELAPGERRVVPFTIAVPEDATPGDHPGGILASVATQDQQLSLDRRIGSRLYLRVAGDIQPSLTIAGLAASYLGDWWNPFDGSVRMQYTIENTGNVALASNITVGARTWFDLPVGGDQGDAIPELLPGTTRTYETDLPGIASVLYLDGWLRLDPFVEGDDATKDLGVDPIERDTVLFAPPWIVVIAAGVIALLVAWRGWRRRVDRRRAAEWIAYTEAEAVRKAADGELVGAGPVGAAR